MGSNPIGAICYLLLDLLYSYGDIFIGAIMFDRQKRIDVLKRLGESEREIPIELLLEQGFPRSVVYSAYWSAAQPGARLAYALGCRVQFSRKFGTIKLIPMTEQEKSLQDIRIERSRLRSAERNSETRNLIRKLLEGRNSVENHNDSS